MRVDIDQTQFVVSDQVFQAFVELLEQEPRDIPALTALLTEPSWIDCGD